MKHVKPLFAILLALSMIIAACACSFELGGEITTEMTADDKQGTVQLFNDFFEKTFANTNQVITATSDGEVQMVETIDGTSDYATYSTTGASTWSFIKDGEYIYAMTGEEVNYYMVGEKYYNYGYFAYKGTFDLLDDIPEEEGVTFSAAVKTVENKGSSTGTMTYEVSNGDAGHIKVEATAKDGLVDSITINTTNEGKTVVTTMTIVYGSASVTVPDISDWAKEEF